MGYVRNEKNSFILFYQDKCMIDLLENEQAGLLLKNIFNYELGLDLVEGMNDKTNMLFLHIANYLDINKEKYKEKCEKLSENGKKGGIAKAEKYKAGKVGKSQQKLAKLADIVIDNDNVTDNDNDNVSVIDNMQDGTKTLIQLSDAEYKELCDRYTKSIADEYIDRMISYIKQKNGKGYGNRTFDNLCKWIEKDHDIEQLKADEKKEKRLKKYAELEKYYLNEE